MIRVDNFLGAQRHWLDGDFLNERAYSHYYMPDRRMFVQWAAPNVPILTQALRQYTPGLIEAQMTRYGNGDHGDLHQDGLKHHWRNRTFVYYRRFGPYTGGDLVVGDAHIEPVDDLLVMFDGKIPHRVETVYSDDQWPNSRFCINGWFVDLDFEIPDPVMVSPHATRWRDKPAYFY